MIKYYLLSEYAITFQFGETISEDTFHRILSLQEAIQKEPLDGYLESVPAYTTLTVFFDVLLLSAKHCEIYGYVVNHVEKLLSQQEINQTINCNLVRVPVCFEDEYAPDLEEICRLKSISKEQFISFYTKKQYHVYMLGFLPGFAYMGEVDSQIAVGRKSTPRLKVSAGSVGIAANQTGVYPMDSPGGWQIVGRTPLKLVDFKKKSPFLFKAGDQVQFYPILSAEFEQMKEQTSVEEVLEMEENILVLKPGVYSVFQDFGRKGCRAQGVPVSGAQDKLSHIIANALVGNSSDKTTLEVTMGGLSLLFKKSTTIAVTGFGNVFVNEKQKELNTIISIQKDDVLDIRFDGKGLRSYIAVSGGFVVEKVLGSSSTSTNAGIGKILSKQQKIFIGKEKLSNHQAGLSIKKQSRRVIRIMPANELKLLTQDSRERLTNEPFTISNRCDRMGILLESERLSLIKPIEMLSTAVVPGTMQLTPDGKIIILMNDCQTTGGYPRIGQVAAADMNKLAQVIPGEKVFFEFISSGEALNLFIDQEKYFNAFEQ